MTWVLVAGAALLLVLLLVLWSHLKVAVRRRDKILAIFALGILPGAWTVAAWGHAQARMRKVDFCMQCHEMHAFGKTLHSDDDEMLSAAHFRNNYIPQSEACYNCHTDYGAFGGVKAKLGGLRHVMAHYTRRIPDTITLYQPYHNSQCLRCHGDSHKYQKVADHRKPAGMADSLASGAKSCLDCHDLVHMDYEARLHGGHGGKHED